MASSNTNHPYPTKAGPPPERVVSAGTVAALRERFNAPLSSSSSLLLQVSSSNGRSSFHNTNHHHLNHAHHNTPPSTGISVAAETTEESNPVTAYLNSVCPSPTKSPKKSPRSSWHSSSLPYTATTASATRRRPVSSPRSHRAEVVHHSKEQQRRSRSISADRSTTTTSPSTSTSRRPTAQELIQFAVMAATAKAAVATALQEHPTPSYALLVPEHEKEEKEEEASPILSSIHDEKADSAPPPSTQPTATTHHPLVSKSRPAPPRPTPTLLHHKSHHHDMSKLSTVATKIRHCRSRSMPRSSEMSRMLLPEESIPTAPLPSTEPSEEDVTGTKKDSSSSTTNTAPPSTNTTTTAPVLRHQMNQLKHWSRRQQKASKNPATTAVTSDVGMEQEGPVADDNETLPPPSTRTMTTNVDVTDLLASKRAYMLSRVGSSHISSSSSSSSRVHHPPSSSRSKSDTVPRPVAVSDNPPVNDTNVLNSGIPTFVNRKVLSTAKKARRLEGKDATQPASDDAPVGKSNAVLGGDEKNDPTPKPTAAIAKDPIKKVETKDLMAERRAYLALAPKRPSTARSSSVPSQRSTIPPFLLMERTSLATAVLPRGKLRNSKARRLAIPPPLKHNNVPVSDTPQLAPTESTSAAKSVETNALSNNTTSSHRATITTPSMSSTEKRNRAKQLISTRRSTTPSTLANKSTGDNSSASVSSSNVVVVPCLGVNASNGGSFDFPCSDPDTTTTTTAAVEQSRILPTLSIDTSMVEAVLSDETHVTSEVPATDEPVKAVDEDVRISNAIECTETSSIAATSLPEPENILLDEAVEAVVDHVTVPNAIVMTMNQQEPDDVQQTSSAIVATNRPVRPRTPSADSRTERRIAQMLKIRSRTSTPTPPVSTIPYSAATINDRHSTDDIHPTDTVAPDNDSTEIISMENDATSMISVSFDSAVTSKEILTCVSSTPAPDNRDANVVMKTQEITEPNSSATILHDDSGVVVYSGPKTPYASTPPFSPAVEAVDKTAAYRAISNDEEDTVADANDETNICDPKVVVDDVVNSTISNAIVANTTKRDKTEILRASSDEEISPIVVVDQVVTSTALNATIFNPMKGLDKTEILRSSSGEEASLNVEPSSLDFRPLNDIATAVVEPSWDSSKVLFNEFIEKTDPSVQLDTKSWDSNIITEAKGDKFELIIPAPTEVLELDTAVKEAALDPLGWPMKLDGLDSSAVQNVPQYIERVEATVGDSDSLLPSKEYDSNIDENEMVNSASVEPSMSKEERIQHYETIVRDDESSVEGEEEDTVEEVEDEEPLSYTLHTGEDNVVDLDICSVEKVLSVLDNVPANTMSFATFAPSAKWAEAEVAGKSTEEKRALPLVETSQVESVLEQPSAIQFDLLLHQSSESLPALPPPPPPPGSKKKKSRRSGGCRAVPLIAPPPAEKLREWQDQKARQIDRLEKMKSKMENLIAEVDASCNATGEVSFPSDGLKNCTLDASETLQADVSNGIIDKMFFSSKEDKFDEHDSTFGESCSGAVVASLTADDVKLESLPDTHSITSADGTFVNSEGLKSDEPDRTSGERSGEIVAGLLAAADDLKLESLPVTHTNVIVDDTCFSIKELKSDKCISTHDERCDGVFIDDLNPDNVKLELLALSYSSPSVEMDELYREANTFVSGQTTVVSSTIGIEISMASLQPTEVTDDVLMHKQRQTVKDGPDPEKPMNSENEVEIAGAFDIDPTCPDFPAVTTRIDATDVNKVLGQVTADAKIAVPRETGLADGAIEETTGIDFADMTNDPATLRGVFSNLSTPTGIICGSEIVTSGDEDDQTSQLNHLTSGKSAFAEAIMVDPTIVSVILDFLGDPVAVCRMKMLNKCCFKYIDDNEHRLMRDAVRLGGMNMSVRPSFWLWVTLCKGQSPATVTNSNENSVRQFDAVTDSDLSRFERQGREGKWFHVIGRDVSRAFGTLPPHKTGARLRTDSIVRALVTWGRSRMMQSGVKGVRDKPVLPDSTPSDEASISPTDTVSDWGGVTPVGSFNGSFTSSNSDPPIAGAENGTKPSKRRHKKQHTPDEMEFALGTNTLTEAMKVTLQQKLSYILHALAAAHPEVGYCQGMDYLVAHLLRMLQETIRWQAIHGNLPAVILSAPCVSAETVRDLSDIYAEVDRSLVVEETCFRVMNSFFTTYSLQHFYWPELRCLKTCCRVFEKIIQLKLPVLADHFEHHELNVGLFALGWFQTLFLYLPSMPSATVCHMWDIWLVERSFKIFFRVGTAILFLSQPILLNHELEGMMGYLNTFPDATLLSPDILIACSLQIKITNRMLMELEQEVQDSAMTC